MTRPLILIKRRFATASARVSEQRRIDRHQQLANELGRKPIVRVKMERKAS